MVPSAFLLMNGFKLRGRKAFLEGRWLQLLPLRPQSGVQVLRALSY